MVRMHTHVLSKRQPILDGFDPRIGGYPADLFPGKLGVVVNFCSRLAAFPYCVPLSVRERANAHGPSFARCLALRAGALHAFVHTYNAFPLPRNMHVTAEAQEVVDEVLGSAKSILWAIVAVRREKAKVVRRLPRSTAAA